MPGSFAHLHVHTEFSVLDGLGTVKDYVARAKELGQPALAITDHGNICGAPPFYRACRDAGIEPIIGQEFYFTADMERHKALKGKSTKHEEMADEEDDGLGRYHVVMLARDYEGYQALAELSSIAHRNFYYKPMLDREMLLDVPEAWRERLVVLSGCAASIISRAVRTGNQDRANAEMVWWREAFPHFNIELQNHKTDFDRELNLGLLDLARRYRVPWLVTNDPHYVVPEDDCHHDALLAIQTAADIDDSNRFRFSGEGYHLKSKQEMVRAFREYGEDVWKPGVRQTLKVARLCHTRIPAWESRTWHIPNYPDADDSYLALKAMTKQGLKDRGLLGNQEYVDRAKYELKVFKQVGISDFLMITWDAIEYARRQGIPVGAGRGSVCGTLVGYLIGIHKIDPIRYGLRFDRFLNPARPKMPDIDTDFGQRRRTEMFDYAEEKYGLENVVHVCTYARMRMKACFQSLAKAHGISYPDRLRISKELSDDDEAEDVLPEEIQENYPDLADQLTRLAGLKRAVSTHPAGVIIASPEMEIRKLVPEMWLPNTKRFVGMYDLDAVEDMGLMKQDFLGLRTLDTIDEAVRLIKATTGEDLDPDSWVPDEEEGDDLVYKMLAEGRTAGVFQMEGPANQRGCQDVQPECFEDVVSVTSLYRTGPIRAGYPKQFNNNRKIGRDRIRYVTPMLKRFLDPTWGVILYQEQVMDIGEHLAGFDQVQVDDIKEAIKHKKSTLMESMKPTFVQGCWETNQIPERAAEQIWKDIEGYSGYSYNRSHAVAYSMTTYQTARLKRLWPTQFIAALLRTVKSDKANRGRRERYMVEAVEMGTKILPPDVNVSDQGATPDMEEDAIRFGLLDIKGIGPKQCEKLLTARAELGRFGSLEEVEAGAGNKGVVAALDQACALGSVGVEGDLRTAESVLGWQFVDPMAKYRRKYRKRVRLPSASSDGELCIILGMIRKVTRGKTKAGKDYVTWHVQWDTTHTYDVRLWSETSRLWGLKEGSVVQVRGKWEARWMNLSIGDVGSVNVVRAVR